MIRTFACIAFTLGTVAAQQPTLVEDINTGVEYPCSSSPKGMSHAGSTIAFAATRNDIGRELFVTRGTTSSTQLCADIAVGPRSSDPGGFVAMNDRHYFTADDGVHGRELWTSDGTAPGTHMVADVLPGSGGSEPRELVAVGRTLFFCARSGGGCALWRSDGSAAGTVAVAGFVDLTAISALGSTVAFIGDDGRTGRELWISDGTLVGTHIVRDIAVGSQGSVSSISTVGSRVFFTGREPSTGWEPWISDGTAAGTRQIADLNRGSGSSSPGHWWPIGSRALFFTDLGLHVTDGTATGTRVLSDLNPGRGLSRTTEVTEMGGVVYFVRRRYTPHRDELWATDGSPNGTSRVLDLGESHHRWLSPLGDALYYAARTPATGDELWSWSSQSGARLIKDAVPGPGGTSPAELFAPAGGTRLFYVGIDRDSGQELWSSDGTAAGTALLADLNPGVVTRSANPSSLVEIGGDVCFIAENASLGRELWRSDGTAAGTTIVRDIGPGPMHGTFDRLVEADGIVYFVANDGVYGSELWASDGTLAGTTRLTDLGAGPYDEASAVLGVDNTGGVYFYGSTSTSRALFRWDGSSTTVLRLGLYGVPQATEDLFTIGPWSLFAPRNSPSLWRSDGTAAGTAEILDFGAINATVNMLLGVWEGALYFGVEHQGTGSLWKSDGTVAGTVPISSIAPALSEHPQIVPLHDHAVYVGEHNGTTVVARTDGTAAGTQVGVGLGISDQIGNFQLAPVQGDVVAVVTRVFGGVDLWNIPRRGMALRILTIPDAGASRWFGASGERYCWFATSLPSPTSETTVWRTDGQYGGNTVPIATSRHLIPMERFAMSRGQLLFAGYGASVGYELFRFDPGASTQSIGDACGATLSGGDPALGATVQLTVQTTPATAPVAMILGLPPRRPLIIQPRCAVHVDLTAAHVVFAATANNHHTSTHVTIPASPLLIGMPVVVQAVVAPGGTRLGIDLSGALVWTPGR